MDSIQFFDFKFIDKQLEHDQIYTFKFKPITDFKFTAGQWIHLGFPTQNKDKERVRHMSFSSCPNDEHLEFTMDTSSSSLYKSLMLQLKSGDVIKGFKINGNLIIDPNIHKSITFIAGGIGITPIRSLIRDINKNNVEYDWRLLHISRDKFIYQNELQEINKQQWRVNRQQLDFVWDNVIEQSHNSHFFICGSNRFVEGLVKKLENSNIPREKIIVEDFK